MVQHRSLTEAFARIARQQPARCAVASQTQRLSYGDLDARSSAVAGAVAASTERVGDRVALLMRHDAPLFAAALGVLKAGRVVVVLDPGDPAARLAQVLADAEPSLLVCDGPHHTLAKAAACCPLLDADELRGRPHPCIAGPDDLAFLVYTSGSTGRPRAVMLAHHNVLDNVRRLTARVPLRRDDRVALFASLGGGQGLATTWCALLSGATLCPYAFAERGLADLGEWMRRQAVSVQTCPTSLFRQAVDGFAASERFPDVRVVRLGAEAATSDDLAALRRHYLPRCVLLHTYSCCETGNVAQSRLASHDAVSPGRLPVGHPSDGIDIRLTDEDGRDVPPGDVGRIVVRGRHLSPGYWRDPALTAERFVGGGFRGGDLGRILPCGRLAFVGRADGQVKVRGHRAHPSEVEEALARQPGVRQAAVVGREEGGAARLVAYVSGVGLRPDHLRRELRQVLPEHLVPAECVVVERLPLTPQGKVDRDRLRREGPPAVRSPQGGFATPAEARLARIWRQALEGRPVGRHDTFLDAGGDSLRAAAVAALARSEFGVDLGLAAFVGSATLAELAARLVATGSDAPLLPLVRVGRRRPLPLSSSQERFWRYSQTPETSVGYVKARAASLVGPLDVERLRQSMSYVTGRHEILRTTFGRLDGEPVQVVHPPGPVEVPLLDFSGEADPEARATALLRHEAKRPFDLSRLPLARFWLVRLRERTHWLLRVHHHLISDSWSWVVYFREVGRLYEASLAGQGDRPLPPLAPVQYGDYAVWQRAMAQPHGDAYRSAVEWWRRRLEGARPLELPFRRPVPAEGAAPHEGYLWWGMPPRTSARADQLARQTAATPFAVRLAALAALLAADSRQHDVVLGVYVSDVAAGRARKMFGPFTNLVTLRLRVEASSSFRQWVVAVREEVVAAQMRADVPYETLAEELRRGGCEVPEIRLIFQVSEQAIERFGGVELKWVDRQVATMPWGFSLALERDQEADRNSASFDARLYDPAGVRAFLARYRHLLDAASSRPERTLAELWQETP